MDFLLNCKIYRDKSDFEISCEIEAVSEKAVSDFGDCKLGFINLSYEKDVINYLVKKYKIPKDTIVLELVSRNKRCDKDDKLKGIGISMICSVLGKLVSSNYTHIYIESLPKLVPFYENYGFKVIESQKMIAKVSDIEKKCKYKLKVVYKT